MSQKPTKQQSKRIIKSGSKSAKSALPKHVSSGSQIIFSSLDSVKTDISVTSSKLAEGFGNKEELILYFYQDLMQSNFLKSYEVLDDFSQNVPRKDIQTDLILEETIDENSKDIQPSDTENLNIAEMNGNNVILKKNVTPLESKITNIRSSKNSFNKKALPTVQEGTIKSDTSRTSQSLLNSNIEEKSIDKAYLTNGNWIIKKDEKTARIAFTNGNIYEGDVLNKVPHGKGTFIWADGTTYQGEFQDMFPSGKGIMVLSDTSQYEGTFYKGFFHGNGIFNIKTNDILYNGGWKYGKKDGNAWLLYAPGSWYEGQFQNDLRHGYGFRQYKNGACYQGYWANNLRHGDGAMRWFNNDVYIGQWTDGVINGYGEYVWKMFRNNSFSFPCRNMYKGSWMNGQRHGAGILHFGLENGSRMAGIFKNNFKHGGAIVVCGNGKTVEGNPLFENDKPVHVSTAETQEHNDVDMNSQDQTFQKMRQADSDSENFSSKCNPIEIPIHTSPNDVELKFYIDHIVSMYAYCIFDRFEFDCDSILSRSSSSKYQSSRWNLITLTSVPFKLPKPGLIHPQSQRTMTVETDHLDTVSSGEEKHLKNTITRHLPKLMEVYYKYATLMTTNKVYFRHYLIRMFLWQLYIDMQVTKDGVSLVEIDEFLQKNPDSCVESTHHPFEQIYFFQFVMSLLGLTILLHKVKRDDVFSRDGILAFLFENFLQKRVFPCAGRYKGRSLFEFKDLLPLQAVYNLYLTLGEPHTARDFLNSTCVRKGEEPPCYKKWMYNKPAFNRPKGYNANSIGHNFLYMPDETSLGLPAETPLPDFAKPDPFAKDLATFRSLGPRIIVRCIASVCPHVQQNEVLNNIDYRITFLEFYEILILCSLVTTAREKKKEELIRNLDLQVEEIIDPQNEVNEIDMSKDKRPKSKSKK